MKWPADKSYPLRICAAFSLFFLAASCERMTASHGAQLVKDAEAKAAESDYLRAVALYEAALDGSTQSADIHYQLALLYDDKMNDPLHALHHFKRYLTLAPTGSHAVDAKKFMKRDEMALLTTLSGDSVVPRAQFTRLKNDNLRLSQQIEERRVAERNAATASGKTESKTERIEKKESASTKTSNLERRSYVVQPGDTLASISRKFYKTSARWKDIQEANARSIDNPTKLKVGQSLSIP